MGEVAQVAGLLQLLRRELPEVKCTLWANALTHGVGEWLGRHFPKVKCLTGTTGRDGKPDQPELQQAWAASDFFLHGPATHVVARDHLEAWRKHTGKPYGIYGVTLDSMDEKLHTLLAGAAFVCLRDGASRALALRQGLPRALVSFVPDAALALKLPPSAKAHAWLAEQKLTDQPFICVVPKLRHPPYWQIFERAPKYAEVAQAQTNAQWQQADHQLLRDTLGKYLSTQTSTIVCAAEMPYQVALGQEMIAARMPEHRCIVRAEPCLPDEAATLFSQAQWVLSMELLSAVVAETVGTPAVHLRPATDATQGQMWRDIGLQDWLFEMAGLQPTPLCEALLRLKENPEGRALTLERANEFIRASELQGVARLQHALGG